MDKTGCTDQWQQVSLFLREYPSIHLWKCFPPPLVKQSRSAPFQNGVLHVRTSSCVCLYNKHETSPTSLSNEHYKPEALNTTFSPLWWCWNLCIRRNPNARAANNNSHNNPTKVDLDTWELEWIHLASSSSGLFYNLTGCIGIYRIYRYRMAEVCTWPQVASAARWASTGLPSRLQNIFHGWRVYLCLAKRFSWLQHAGRAKQQWACG